MGSPGGQRGKVGGRTPPPGSLLRVHTTHTPYLIPMAAARSFPTCPCAPTVCPALTGLETWAHLTTDLATDRAIKTNPAATSTGCSQSRRGKTGFVAVLENPCHLCSVSACLSAQPCVCEADWGGGVCLSAGLQVCAHIPVPLPSQDSTRSRAPSAFPPCLPRPHLCSAGPIHHLYRRV